jgi:serine/threonine protein kinase
MNQEVEIVGEEIRKSVDLKNEHITKYCLNDFEMQKLIGRGSFGQVFLVQNKISKDFYALKSLKKDIVLHDPDGYECAKLERDVMKFANENPFITKLFCTFQNDEHLFFVMEFLNGGDLMFHMLQSRQFNETRARFYAVEIASAIQFLHSINIVYRDLKLDNIILDSEGHCKIADFGMCKKFDIENCKTQTFCGTPDYIAPEVIYSYLYILNFFTFGTCSKIIMGQPYNHSIDWWSFGVLIFEMLTGCSPFSGVTEEDLYKDILKGNLYFPPSLSLDAVDCIRLFFEREPSKRLGMKTSPHGRIRDQKFFSRVNWDQIEARNAIPPFKPLIVKFHMIIF